MLLLVIDGLGEFEIDCIWCNGQGWFEGGSFKDNVYLMVNFGFGVECYFLEWWSFFVQLVYQYFVYYFKNIDGLGLNNDWINLLLVLIGICVCLKQFGVFCDDCLLIFFF